jgi:hypothetical protein
MQPLPDVRVPDLVEEILGWKVLAVVARGEFRDGTGHSHHIVVPNTFASPLWDTVWPADGWLRATCSEQHQPPAEDCTCGVYAVASPSDAAAYVGEAPLTTLARVALAGKLIPATRGWRAERARIVALTRTGIGVHEWAGLFAAVARRYDVPILDLDFLDHDTLQIQPATVDRKD